MKRLIIYVVILIVAICLGLLLQANTGYVLIAYNNWTAETSVWFGIIILFVAFLVAYYFIRLIKFLFSSRGHVLKWRKQRAFVKAHSVTGGGLLALQEADWDTAERLLLRGVNSSTIPVVNYLGAAQAAQGNAAYKRRDKHLEAAHKRAEDVDEKLAVALTKASLNTEHHQYEEALSALEEVENYNARHPLMLSLRYQIYTTQKDWSSLSELLPKLKRQRVFDKAKLENIENAIYENLLKTSGDNLVKLKEQWKSLPRAFRKQSNLVKLYCRCLFALHENNEAAEVIADYMSRDFSARLVTLYGKLNLTVWEKQLKQVQAWVKKYGESPSLLNAQANIALAGHQWQQAQEAATRSLSLDETIDAYNVLARASDAVGDSQSAQAALQKSLNMLKVDLH